LRHSDERMWPTGVLSTPVLLCDCAEAQPMSINKRSAITNSSLQDEVGSKLFVDSTALQGKGSIFGTILDTSFSLIAMCGLLVGPMEFEDFFVLVKPMLGRSSRCGQLDRCKYFRMRCLCTCGSKKKRMPRDHSLSTEPW